jgi:site-specific DNA recombinase
MPKYVIYARKSSESEDRQVLSIDSQVHELSTLAVSRGIVVAEVLTEAHSAKSPGRPVFGALMRRVAKGEVHGIVCWKLDRLARNHADTGQVLQALADGKLQAVVTPDRTYTPDGNDRFMGNFELGMATKFIDDLRQNVKRGNRARFERGWINYLPPPGYMNDKATRTIVKDPDRFDLVRQMWDLLLPGSMRPSQILRTANERWGFRTRKYSSRGGTPLAFSVMYNLFANPFYMGVIRLRSGQTYRGAHPPMVTPEEFQRAQELLGRPGRPRPAKHEFPFTGLLRCGNCGGTAVAEQHLKPNGKRYVYYRCSHNRTGRPCREPAVPVQELERQLAETLLTIKITPKAASWIEARLTRTLADEAETRATVRERQTTTLSDLKREADTLLSLRLRNQIDDATFNARSSDIQQRVIVLETVASRPEQTKGELLGRLHDVLAFAARAHETFTSGTPVQQRQILESVGLNYSLSNRKASFQLKNPFRVMAGAPQISDWCARTEELRTWLRGSEEFVLPDLDHPPDTDSVPDLPWVA